jgi:hypothetical protein
MTCTTRADASALGTPYLPALGAKKLHRRDAKNAIKEARLWRTKNGLGLPFLD